MNSQIVEHVFDQKKPRRDIVRERMTYLQLISGECDMIVRNFWWIFARLMDKIKSTDIQQLNRKPHLDQFS